MKTILVTGQCTLHWGRLEYGNIGNYYVAEPLFRELRKVFPDAEVRTTFQMSDAFCEREGITRLPMELYYGWDDLDLETAEREYQITKSFAEGGQLAEQTPYIEEVLNCDLFVDFSGDIWGDNADLVGPNRFYIGLLKDRVAQLLGKKTAMIAGSPGPFTNPNTLPLAQEVFKNFDVVTNREEISIKVLRDQGFEIDHVHSCACPAFLFEPSSVEVISSLLEAEGLMQNKRPAIGFVLCGWNMTEGPYTKWPRDDAEYDEFTQLVGHVLESTDADIYFMSHSNGFELPPNFKLIQGRDQPFAQQMYEIALKQGWEKRVHVVGATFLPPQMKGVLGNLDALISGRVHAAVGALAQNVPTLVIDYGHEPKAHKLRGFARVAGVEEFLVDPADVDKMKAKFSKMWDNREQIHDELRERMKVVRKMSRENFEILSKSLA
ncbi:polysaccharide pyruvyl transferase family protein [Rubritalea tangerina]|uniref:Polysaccharide pyruvyl transferase family protein n=1 Tax=Rubritalea tangerina TaxID=430798 RepID=A0ABW4ZDC3_9BACT